MRSYYYSMMAFIIPGKELEGTLMMPSLLTVANTKYSNDRNLGSHTLQNSREAQHAHDASSTICPGLQHFKVTVTLL